MVSSAILATSAQTGGLHSPLSASASSDDTMYVGDNGDPLDSIKRFDAQTGQFLGAFGPTGIGSLDGVRRLLLAGTVGNLLVAKDNVIQFSLNGVDGEIDQFDPQTGSLLAPLVPDTAIQVPETVRGLILGPDNHTLYVAEATTSRPER